MVCESVRVCESVVCGSIISNESVVGLVLFQ